MVLAPFVPLVVAILCLALATIITVLMVNVMNSLGGLPVIGGKLAGLARSVAATITRVCSAALSGIEALIGGTFHRCATFLDRTWHLIAETPNVVAHLARVVGDGVYRVSGLRAAVHYLERIAHFALHKFGVIERELHGIEHGIKTLERELGKGIGEDVLPRLNSLDRELAKLRNKVIPGVKDIAEGAETDAQAALGKIEAIPYPTSAKSWGEAIAAGLTALGLGWLSCRSNPFNRNPNACGALGDLGDLLGLIVAIEAALDFDALVHEAQDVAEVTATGIMDVFGLSNE